MPNYDYFCESNGRTVEVHHRMAETVATWGELCERAGIDLAGTPAETPVQRMMSMAMTATSGDDGGAQAAGGCCPCGKNANMCGMN